MKNKSSLIIQDISIFTCTCVRIKNIYDTIVNFDMYNSTLYLDNMPKFRGDWHILKKVCTQTEEKKEFSYTIKKYLLN